jgi:phosphoserine phosphatase
MDDNTMLAKRIRDEIMDVANSFPQFAPEIVEMVEAHERRGKGVGVVTKE